MNTDTNKTDIATDRRKFLSKCGKFAIVTPPIVTMLLSTSMSSKAVAQSGFVQQVSNSFGSGGNNGVPENSDFISYQRVASCDQWQFRQTMICSKPDEKTR
ncbi:MAG: hypothetical protein WD407_09445 [Rhodospirillales bacterium]